MSLHMYLNLCGQCEAAFRYYAQHLGAQITAIMRFSDAPEPPGENIDAEWHDRIMHASLEIDEQLLMATDGDCGGGSAARGIRGAHVVLGVDNPAAAERLYEVLSAGGAVEMPLGETFFARRFGMTVDRFGVPWMVLCE